MARQNRTFQLRPPVPLNSILYCPPPHDQEDTPRSAFPPRLWQPFPPYTPWFPTNLRATAASRTPMFRLLGKHKKLPCSLSVNYFSPKHTFPISQVTNYSSSKALACNQFPQRINFHSSPSFTLPLSTDYFNSNASKIHPVFHFQLSQSKPWALHNCNSLLICLLTLLLKIFPNTLSLHQSLAQKPLLSPQYTQGKMQSPSLAF